MPEKGDAWDYFSAGGKVEELFSNYLSRQKVDWIEADHYHITLPSDTGILVRLDFEKLSYNRNSLDAELIAGPLHPSGDVIQPLIQNINLLSMSSRQQLERCFSQLFGKHYGWPRLINDSFALIRHHIVTQNRTENLADSIDSIEQFFLVDSILPLNSHTLIFGDGHSGKSYIALSMAISIYTGTDWLSKQCRMGKILYLDYEDTKETLQRRLRRLCGGMEIKNIPPILRYPASGIPLHDLAETLLDVIRKNSINLLIIDSAALACGGKPEDAETTLKYFRVLDSLGITTLSIAHISKGSDTNYPFGSIYWHNAPRRTWYVEKLQEEEYPEELILGMYCRKVNEGPKPKPICFQLTFHDPDGIVQLSPAQFEDIPSLNERRPLKTRIWEKLNSPQTQASLVETLGTDTKTIDKALRRNHQTVC